METKTYTAMNEREYLGNRAGTARQDWVESMLCKFPEAVDIYKTNMSPARWEPHHSQMQNAIDEAKEENGFGIEILVEEFLERLNSGAEYDFLVYLNVDEESNEQLLKVSTGLADYEMILDTTVVRWQA